MANNGRYHADTAWCHECNKPTPHEADELTHIMYCETCGVRYNERKVPRGGKQ